MTRTLHVVTGYLGLVLSIGACNPKNEDPPCTGPTCAPTDAGIDGPIFVMPDASGACRVTTCNGKTLECGDCLNNDNDPQGLVDSADPECLGPCDNTEGPALAAGIGGQTGGPCKADCYFDFGNGPGNDDCHWNHQCDPLEVRPSYYPEGSTCAYDPSLLGTAECPTTQSAQCESYCRPLTPNGCDCFGCCTFPQLDGVKDAGGTGYVWIGALDRNGNGTCTFADILDPSKCPPCTPVANCINTCEPCEVCIGKPAPDPSCQPTEQCASGVQACGPNLPACEPNTYCITGCCYRIP